MLTHTALVPLLLGMLHALGPPTRWRAGGQQQQLEQQQQAGAASAQALPVAAAVAEAAACCPIAPPFPGYRTSVLSGERCERTVATLRMHASTCWRSEVNFRTGG